MTYQLLSVMKKSFFKHIEEMFPRYYMQGDVNINLVCILFKTMFQHPDSHLFQIH